MKPATRNLALLSLAAAAGLAWAPLAGAAETPVPEAIANHVNEPIASLATGARGPNLDAANAIVQALAGDASLKQSKITVTPEEQGILLTGVTPKLAQLNRILKVASQQTPDGRVVNGIAVEEVFIAPNPTGTVEQPTA